MAEPRTPRFCVVTPERETLWCDTYEEATDFARRWALIYKTECGKPHREPCRVLELVSSTAWFDVEDPDDAWESCRCVPAAGTRAEEAEAEALEYSRELTDLWQLIADVEMFDSPDEYSNDQTCPFCGATSWNLARDTRAHRPGCLWVQARRKAAS